MTVGWRNKLSHGVSQDLAILVDMAFCLRSCFVTAPSYLS